MSLYVNGSWRRRPGIPIFGRFRPARRVGSRRTLFLFRERGGGEDVFCCLLLLLLSSYSSCFGIFVMVPLIFLVLLRPTPPLPPECSHIVRRSSSRLAIPKPSREIYVVVIIVINEDPFAPFVPSSSPLHTLLGPFAFAQLASGGLAEAATP